MGNRVAYLVMETILSIFRGATVVVFQIALMNFWRALKSSSLIKQYTKAFLVHWIMLTAYAICEIASLTLILIANFTEQDDETESQIWFANSVIWCTDNFLNFVAILVVLDIINKHY